jgi:predicted O-methyltransferase YrrM
MIHDRTIEQREILRDHLHYPGVIKMITKKSERVLRELEKLAANESLPIVGPEKGKVLARLIRKVQPIRILEVGTLIGYSAILIGQHLRRDAHLITLEIHAEDARIAEENILRAEIPPVVEVIVGDAKEVIPKLKGTFDLIFIDAEKREYIDYIRLVEKKFHKGSLIVADNVVIFVEEVKDYLEYVRSSGKYRSKFIPVGADGLEVSTKL